MTEEKCIGVLTSGGDAPGMNAAIRAVVRSATFRKIKVLGIRQGYQGLLNGDMSELSPRQVSDIIHRGGTFLLTARSKEFMTPEGLDKAVNISKVFGIGGLVVIGGDGSFRGALELCKRGLPTVGIPGTIDNDIACSEYTIGFDTAVNTALDCINKIRDTTSSHQRCSIIEVMGRNSGNIALHCGIAGGADYVVIPEKPYKPEEIVKAIIESKNRGKRRYIIVVAEGVKRSEEIAKLIQEQAGVETRTTILGHIQRGGNPSAKDIVVASNMGDRAVQLLSEGIGSRVIAVKGDKLVDYDIEEALKMQPEFDDHLYNLTRVLAV